MCMNALLFLPTTTVFPNADNMTDYRLRINGIDATNRAVQYAQSLYNDRLLMTFENMGKQYKLKRLNPSGVLIK